MQKRLFIGALLLRATTFQPLFADYSELQLVGATVAINQVTLQVANPQTSTESARIQVAVRVADGSTEVLTTTTVTVPGSATSTVTVSAPAAIVEILDDPQPIGP
jgi:hypothetical protein